MASSMTGTPPHHPQLALGSTILLQRLLQSLLRRVRAPVCARCAEYSETRASRDCPHIRELMPMGRSAAHQSFVRHSSVCARLLPRIRLRRIKRRADRELLFVTLPLACLCSHTTPGYKPARRYVLKSPKVRETLARKRSGLLLTSDRYVCEAAEIQGTGSRWREVEDTRLEVRASIINRDYD